MQVGTYMGIGDVGNTYDMSYMNEAGNNSIDTFAKIDSVNLKLCINDF